MTERKPMTDAEWSAFLGEGTPEVTSVQQAMRIWTEAELPYSTGSGDPTRAGPLPTDQDGG